MGCRTNNSTPQIKMDKNRNALIAVLKKMPDEAFGWFVGWASGAMIQFPDGLGGFRPESRKAIEELRKAANKYIEKK